MEKVVFKISGMECKSCAKIIECTLADREGIKSAGVNFDSGDAFLEFDESKIGAEEIKREIGQLGYKVLA